MKDWIDKQFDRRQLARIRKYEAKARKAWFKAHLLTEQADQEGTARASSVHDPEKESAATKWFMRKGIVLDQIAALPVPSPIKDEWHKELNSICLTDDTPDALEKLISQVSQCKLTLMFEAVCHNPFAEELKPPPTGTLESLTVKLGRTFDIAGRTDRGANAEGGTGRASDAVNQVIQSLIEMRYTQQLYEKAQ